MGASYRAVFVGCSCQAFGSARLILALRAAYSTCGWWLRHAASGDVPVGAFRGGQAAKRPGGQAARRPGGHSAFATSAQRRKYPGNTQLR